MRLIDADALKRKIHGTCSLKVASLDNIFDIINSEPTVESVPLDMLVDAYEYPPCSYIFDGVHGSDIMFSSYKDWCFENCNARESVNECWKRFFMAYQNYDEGEHNELQEDDERC